jgi:hypothetical protein
MEAVPSLPPKHETLLMAPGFNVGPAMLVTVPLADCVQPLASVTSTL